MQAQKSGLNVSSLKNGQNNIQKSVLTNAVATSFDQWYQKKIVERSMAGQVLRRFRRFYLGSFKPDYVAQVIADTREGNCHRCGLCCQLIYKCPFLGKDSENLPYCRIYGDLRPSNCHNYPIDSTDSEIDECGYKFRSKSKSQSSDSRASGLRTH